MMARVALSTSMWAIYPKDVTAQTITDLNRCISGQLVSFHQGHFIRSLTSLKDRWREYWGFRSYTSLPSLEGSVWRLLRRRPWIPSSGIELHKVICSVCCGCWLILIYCVQESAFLYIICSNVGDEQQACWCCAFSIVFKWTTRILSVFRYSGFVRILIPQTDIARTALFTISPSLRKLSSVRSMPK